MSLIRKEIYDLRVRFLVMILLIAGTGYFVVGYHDLFIHSIKAYDLERALEHSLLARFFSPEQIMAEIEMLIANIDLYIWSQWFGKNFYQLIILACILFAFPVFARENEQGTNEFLLMNLTRAQVFLHKLAAGWLALFFCIALGSILPALLASFFPYEFTWYSALIYGMHMGVAAFFLYGVVIVFSIMTDDTVKPIVASIVALILLALIGRLEPWGYLDVYRYMTGVDWFFYQVLPWKALAVILFLAFLVYGLGWKIYSRRDF